jgi:hypothetical protein
MRGCDDRGIPLDSGHIWHQGGRVAKSSELGPDRPRPLAVLNGKDFGNG